MTEHGKNWKHLAKRATAARARLERLARPLMLGGLAIAMGTGVGLAFYRASRQSRRRLRYPRFDTMRRRWTHPRRAFSTRAPSMWNELARRLAMRALSVVAMEAARRAALRYRDRVGFRQPDYAPMP